MEKTDPPSNAPSPRQGYGILAGGMLLAFFSCLGALTVGPPGSVLGWVMASFFVVGVVITIVAFVQAVRKKR